jgi:UDP-N-acetylglucosamine transferase subunit ALG13
MIFVAVGTQFPFDRLIQCVDEWAAEHDTPAHAQIAEGQYLPQHASWDRFMTTDDFNARLAEASLIISHAGMGNIITALENSKPIIVMNRQHKLGEHRNDHQADGLEWMGKLSGVYTARSCEEMHQLLNHYAELKGSRHQQLEQRRQLIDFIHQAVNT